MKNITRNQIRDGLANYMLNHGVNSLKVACKICGKAMKLSEYEVRYIQYLVSIGELSAEDVKVEKISICPDGYLDESIPLFSINQKLSRELL